MNALEIVGVLLLVVSPFVCIWIMCLLTVNSIYRLRLDNLEIDV